MSSRGLRHLLEVLLFRSGERAAVDGERAERCFVPAEIERVQQSAHLLHRKRSESPRADACRDLDSSPGNGQVHYPLIDTLA